MYITRKVRAPSRQVMTRVIVLMALTASLFLSAPAAHATSATYNVTGVTLEARDLEDNSWFWWDDTDEISVNYAGTRVFGVGSVKQNQPVAIGDRTFSGSSLRVDLYEWDGGSAKHLGTQYISTSLLGEERTLQFGTSNTTGFEYLLRYTVRAA